jgi:hypothetical protein
MKQLSKLVTLTTLAGLFLAIGTVASYVVAVGDASSFNLSKSGKDWAEFGDYLGGVLGTGFSGLAFLVLVWTLRLQQQQIAQLKEQDKFRELQNTISTQANSLDKILSKSVSVVYKKSSGNEEFLKILILVGGMSKELPHNDEKQVQFESFKNAIGGDFALFANSLDIYASLINFYKKRGGDEDIIKIYVARFYLAAKMAHAAGPHMDFEINDDINELFGLAT